MGESSWTHLGIVSVILVPLFLFWLDTRNQRNKMHTETLTRLTALEVMIKPLWNWWNKNGTEKPEP